MAGLAGAERAGAERAGVKEAGRGAATAVAMVEVTAAAGAATKAGGHEGHNPRNRCRGRRS